MLQNVKKHSLYVLLLVSFLDFLGIGLVYPLFSEMLFNDSVFLLPKGTSQETRGIWLGLLVSLTPLFQFISSSFWGTLSDVKGRKRTLIWSITVSLSSNFIALYGIYTADIYVLLISRVLVGLGSGNIAIVKASIADISTPKNKVKNYGLYGMSMGAGFTFGPFIGGPLTFLGFSEPFIFALLLSSINLILVFSLYKETLIDCGKRKLSLLLAFTSLSKAFQYKDIRIIFLCSFIYAFGWAFFMDLVPIYLIETLHFSRFWVGAFYGIIGASFAISSGLLIRPFLARYKPELLLFYGMLMAGISVILIMLFSSIHLFVLLILIISFFAAFVAPTTTTIVSNKAACNVQGQALGVLGSIKTLSYGLGGLLAGLVTGLMPSLSIIIGGSAMILASLLLGFFLRKILFVKKA